MTTLDDILDLRPEGIDYEFEGHTITIMPSGTSRKIGMGQPDIPLDWDVLSDGWTVGYLERGQDELLAWKPTQLDDGTPATTNNVDDAVRFLVGDVPKPQHHHGKKGHH